jgi:hypothetical protein
VKQSDESIARKLKAWVDEDIGNGLARFRGYDFEEQVRRRLAGKEKRAGRITFRRRLILVGTTGVVLAVLWGVALRFRPSTQTPVTGPEAIRLFLANHSTLRRFHSPPGAAILPTRPVPAAHAIVKRLSRHEMAELFRIALPERDFSVRRSRPTGVAPTAPPAFRNTFLSFFSVTLESLKEEKNG